MIVSGVYFYSQSILEDVFIAKCQAIVKNDSAYRLVVFVFRHLLKTNAGALLHPASTVNKSSGSVFSRGCLDAGFFPYFAIRVETRPRENLRA